MPVQNEKKHTCVSAHHIIKSAHQSDQMTAVVELYPLPLITKNDLRLVLYQEPVPLLISLEGNGGIVHMWMSFMRVLVIRSHRHPRNDLQLKPFHCSHNLRKANYLSKETSGTR
eukprot:scaffold15296_cov114-Cylindrotheca_fusiformis.AAC.3